MNRPKTTRTGRSREDCRHSVSFDGRGVTPPSDMGGAQNYGSAFLPAIYQGTRVGSSGRKIAEATIRNLEGKLSAGSQRAVLDLAQALNHEQLEKEQYNPEWRG